MTMTECENCGHLAEHRGMDCIYSVLGIGICPDCMAEVLTAINVLRQDEGDAVTILCDNPEPPPNVAISVNGSWTGWKETRFEGKNLAEALLYAAKVRTLPEID